MAMFSWMVGAAAATTLIGAVTPLDQSSLRGYPLKTSVYETANGLELHGRVCRMALGIAPAWLHADQVSETGEVLDSMSHSLSSLQSRNSTCTFYDLRTHWKLAPGQRVRLCVERSDKACPATG